MASAAKEYTVLCQQHRSCKQALEFVDETITDCDQRYLAYKVLDDLSYDFAFGLLLMQDVLGVMNELSLALDREDLEAENCMAVLHESRTNCR
jgi:hypothetical protein